LLTRRSNIIPNILTLRERETPSANAKAKCLQHQQQIFCNFFQYELVRSTTRTHPKPSGPQPNMTTYPITSFKLVSTFGTLKTTSKHQIHIGFKPKNFKNFKISILIKKSIKPRPNDLKFCKHITNNTTDLLQLLEFHSDPYIKISPINEKTPKFQFHQFKHKSTPDLQNTF